MTLSQLKDRHEAISDETYAAPVAEVLEFYPDTLICQSMNPGDIDWFGPDGNL